MIDHCGNFGVGIDIDKAAGELRAFADIDDPCVVFGVAMAELEQFLENDIGLHAIGRGERIKLVWMIAFGQILFALRPGCWPIDIGKAAAALAVMGPDFWRGVGWVSHAGVPSDFL